MADFTVRSDNVDVEQIMGQIRARIGEKRGVDYTEDEIRELANVKLEKFLDPRGVRSELLDRFRRAREADPPPNFVFEDTTIYETHRGLIRALRRMLNPLLKLFFNPNPISQALHIQAELNQRNARREDLDLLNYEVLHNLVVEITRLGIEVKNLKMRVESMSSRLDFDERRARALEGVVQYRPGAVPPLQPQPGADSGASEAEQAERRSRRRRRRGRRRGGSGPGGGPAAETDRGTAAGDPDHGSDDDGGDSGPADGGGPSDPS
jgi:hypothetical protein